MSTNRDALWLSLRRIRRAGEPEWAEYLAFIGLPQLTEVRTIDSWCNPCSTGNYLAGSLEQVWDLLEIDMLPVPASSDEYYLLFTDAFGPFGQITHPRLRLLGYDLSDETWTSSLLNCGRWQGVLEPIAQRVNGYGLLSLEDAKLAQDLLPGVWAGDPHSRVTIWSLFEVQSAAVD